MRPDHLYSSYFTRAVEKSGSAEHAAGACVLVERIFTILTPNKTERGWEDERGIAFDVLIVN